MKKLLCILLTAALTFVCLCTCAFSESTLKLTEETYPTEIVKGSTFSAYGIVSSSCDIQSVTISVTDSDGDAAFTYTGKPGTKTYDIHNVDYLLTFSKLNVGTYTYRIVASDSQTNNQVLLSKSFKVVNSASPVSLEITGANYPETIAQGETFSIYGTVSSENTITSVTCSVYSTGGALQFTKTVEPYSTEYSLLNIDKYMTFSKLTTGRYIYSVKASDTKTKDHVLLSKEFSVSSSAASSPIRLTGANYPTTYTEGTSFSVEGIVSSDNILSSVVMGVYSQSGVTQFVYTAKPGAKSYNIHNADYLLTFSKLKAGSYVYRITASDSVSKNVVLLEKSFTVTVVKTPESEMKRVSWRVIDTSKWDEFVSWDRITAAVDGIIIRLGNRATGTHAIYLDPKFATCYEEFSKRGTHLGCYFYSAALTEAEAVEEANYVISTIKKYNCKFDMPIYFDMETEDQVALSAAAATRIARAFCDTISNAGYFPGIYCNKYFARDELNASQLSDISFWIAEYNSSCTYNGPYGMWQFSETGGVSGINGYVDLNYCYYDYPSYIRSKGLNNLGGAVVETPKYEILTGNGGKIDQNAKIIYQVTPGMTTDSFKNAYISSSSNVTVAFGNTVGGKVATGTTVTLKNGDKTLAAYTVSVKGDTDGNAVLNSTDALIVLECTIGKKTLSGAKKYSADYNGDGKTNSSDALGVLQYAVRYGG